MQLKATVLIDNIAAPPLTSEWGLAIYIEYGEHRLLLDTGGSGQFADNALKLGIPLDRVEAGVLSHAHYDHADGIPRFFAENSAAPFWLQQGTEENCYSGDGEERHYIGVRRGLLTEYRDRIAYAAGKQQLFEGVWLLSHTADMTEAGSRAKMYLLRDGEWETDRFSHEQSLVFETDKGLVVFNSCCHGGADVIIREAREAFGCEVHALVGGFHLFRSSDSEVLAMAERLRDAGVERLVTGHCTGERGFLLLREALGTLTEQMYTGMTLEF